MEILFDEQTIQKRISEMASEISAYYKRQEWYKYTMEPVHILCVMFGGLPFTTDLMKRLSIRFKYHWMRVSSYCGTTTSIRDPKILVKPRKRFLDDNILIVDDILESGKTIRTIKEHIKWPGQDIRTAVLLRKPDKISSGVRADFIGFDIPDKFVVGYGLDYKNRYRKKPYVAVWGEDESGSSES